MAEMLTAGKMRLRDYQSDAVLKTWDWLNENDGAPIIWAPVGAGKSVIMAEMMRQACDDYPDTRILMLTHSAELVMQNHAKLLSLWPDAPAGIFAASRGKRDLSAQIMFGTIQSVWKRGYDIGRVDLILIDEAHTISRKEKTMWGRFLKECGRCNPEMRIVGLTGTPWRLDSGSLVEGDGRMFHGVSFKIGMDFLIEKGFLCPVITKPTALRVDTTGVKKTAGDFNIGQLTKAVDDVTVSAVEDFMMLGADRRTWMIFAPSVENAEHISAAVRSRGQGCAVVTAQTPASERDEILQAMRDGVLRSAVSVGTLTTGVDVPPVDLIVGLRPTLSSSLVIQMIGRGMRLSPDTGKTDCLLLDYAGWLRQHGPVDLIQPPAPPGSGAAPVKNCPECETLLPIHVMTCPTCGHVMTAEEKPKERPKASNLAALSSQIEPVEVPVLGVKYSRHAGRDGKKDTLRVQYSGPIQNYSKFIPIEHEGMARYMGTKWWAEARRDVGSVPPQTIDEALKRLNELRVPSSLVIIPVGKYPEITAVHYEQ